jgi:hypothetical protein
VVLWKIGIVEIPYFGILLFLEENVLKVREKVNLCAVRIFYSHVSLLELFSKEGFGNFL